MSMSKFFGLCVVFFISFTAKAVQLRPGVVPEKIIDINVKYDQSSGEFYDFSASGSNWIEVDIVNDNELKVVHGRDGYVNLSQADNIRPQVIRDDVGERSLYRTGGGSEIRYEVGLGNTQLKLNPKQRIGNSHQDSGCTMERPRYGAGAQIIKSITPVSKRYEHFYCRTVSMWTNSYSFGSDVRDIGYIERYLRFNEVELKRASFGEYSGGWRSNSVNTSLYVATTVNEYYTYRVFVNVKPSVNRFVIDHETVNFSVNKQKYRIVGKAQTGFTVQGSFLNSQAFDMTFNSSNSALCGEALCLSNSAEGTTIPYMVNVFDPATLLEKSVSRNGQKVTIYADQDYRLSGGMFFEFDTDNTALSGTFNDILTVRVELKLI